MARGPRGDAGRRAERRTLRRIAASGSWAGAKGDMRGAHFLLENKSTVRDSLGLKLEVLRKIAREAATVGLRPALSVQYTDEHGKPRTGGAWVLVREEDWAAMTDPELAE